jgi:hypothetical protein
MPPSDRPRRPLLPRWLRRPAPPPAAPAPSQPPLPRPPGPVEQLIADSPLRARYQAAAEPRFMLVGLFGLDAEAAAARAAQVDAELCAQGVIPVYLTDGAAVEPLRRARRLFEVLPTAWSGHQLAPDLDWPFYLRRRYLLLLQKWRPLGFIAFGETPAWLPTAEASTSPAKA